MSMPKKGIKSIKDTIRDYLLEHKEISTRTAEDKFGWYRIRQYMWEFKEKESMNIISKRIGDNNTLYVLEDERVYTGLEMIDAEPQEEPKTEIKLQPEDMHIKTTMKEVILDHLKKHKTITSAIAMRKYKCLNLYNIISKLREEGWNITRSLARENNDFNVASNRNNAYTVYTLENKTRKKTIYKTTYICQVVAEKSIPEMVEIHESKMKAMGELNRITDLMVQDLNLFYGNSMVEFIKVVDTDSIMVVKKETIKKLFKKKYETMMLAKFSIYEEEVEV